MKSHSGSPVFRRVFAIVAVAVACLCAVVCAVWWCGRGYARVALGKTYYCLVRDCEESTSVAVSTQVYLAGGAGYLIEEDGKSVVVLSCYYGEDAAKDVQKSMVEKGVNARVLTFRTKDFELSGQDISRKERILETVETVDINARILYDTANGLERGEISQEKARAAVRGVVASLGGIRKDDGFSEEWRAEIERAERKGKEIAEGILFAKDLRYLQAELTFAILRADEFLLN